MGRHILDTEKSGSAKRLSAYADIDRHNSGPHPATRELQRRPKLSNDSKRTQEFMRIDRKEPS